MGIYKRGTDFERDLVTDFWNHGWAAVRAAGSGTRVQPVPDVVIVKEGNVVVVECKTTKKDRLSLKPAIKQLAEFTKTSGGQGYLAIRFYRKKARFYPIHKLVAKGNYTICEKDEYMSLDQVIGEQTRLM